MAVNIISVKCPNCEASLDIEADRNQVFCTYCGAKLIINNENEYVYRHIDEASIKQAETDRIMKLKQMEIAEKNRESAEKTKLLKIKISLILATVGIVMMVGGVLLGNATGESISIVGFIPLIGSAYIWLFSIINEDDDFGEKVKVPSSVLEYE
ncbi:MAG: zinc ribbon domain-containing protein [Lachnospiraceae bacterium]|nr:zinc ribbon domain-containing protein [Lachnospiraceae bacterium]